MAKCLEIQGDDKIGFHLRVSDGEGVGLNDWWFATVEEAKQTAFEWFKLEPSAWEAVDER